MQPYQEASEEFNRQSLSPIKTAIDVGAPLAKLGVGLNVGNRILTMLNKHVPASLAAKGLSKIDPRLGKFFSLGQEAGHSEDELKAFIENKVKSYQQEPAKQDKNIIEQYSPELHQFIAQNIAGGRKPIEAAAIAQNDKKFKDVIKKLTKDHNTPWSQIIESIYGTGQYGGALNTQAQPQQVSQQGGQPGPGEQSLKAILGEINQKLGQ